MYILSATLELDTVGTVAGCFLGILMGSVGGGVTGSLFGALLGVVTGSLLGVTWLKILLSNFCCTGVTTSPFSSFNDLANVVGSALTDNDAGSCLNFLIV